MECKKIIMQGDSYFIDFKITSSGLDLDLSLIKRIQFVVGDLVKYYESDNTGEVEFENGYFKFPLSQDESLAMNGPLEVQIRVKSIDNKVVGKVYGTIKLMFSSNKEVI